MRKEVKSFGKRAKYRKVKIRVKLHRKNKNKKKHRLRLIWRLFSEEDYRRYRKAS